MGCHPDCQACSGGDKNQCTMCKQGLVLNQGMCVEYCRGMTADGICPSFSSTLSFSDIMQAYWKVIFLAIVGTLLAIFFAFYAYHRYNVNKVTN